MNRFIKILIAVAILCSLPTIIYAQKKPQLNIIGRITSEQGLLTDGIKYTMKDSRGFMWFSSDLGFYRWDGYEAKIFPEYMTDTNVNSAYRYCRSILEDKKGFFLIGTLKNGLVKLDRETDKYVRYMHDPDDPNSLGGDGIHVLMEDEEGLIWIGTFVEGLSCFDPETAMFKNYKIKKGDTYPWDSNCIRSLCKDSRGIFWVGTSNGLFQFNEIEESFSPIQTDPEIPEYLKVFECSLEDRNGDMWFGTHWGIFKYCWKSGEWEHIETNNPDKPESNADANITCMVEFYNAVKHQIWIGTNAGLKVYDIKSRVLYHLTPKNGYPEITNAGFVQYLYLDDNDILWTSLGGLQLIDLNDNPFHIYKIKTFPDSLGDTPATCFFQDEDGHIFIGTYGDGLYEFDENLNFIDNFKPCTWDPEKSDSTYNNEIRQIYEDKDNRIWIRTGPTGLCIFEKESGEFFPVDVNVGSYVPGPILMDPYGIVWLGAHDGLYKCEVTGHHSIDYELYDNPTVPKAPIDQILYDTKDRLWVVTRDRGVLCLTPENRDSMKFKSYLHEGYRHRFTVEYNTRSMIEDDSGGMWFRSQKALFKYDPDLDSIVPNNRYNESYQDEIHSFTRDKNGIFWFVSRGGLLQFNPQDTVHGRIRIIDARSGVPFNFVERRSFFKDRRGYLYQGGSMATSTGFFRFHPDSVRGPNKTIPPIVLTNFSVKNQPFPLDSNITYKKHIKLDYNQNFFSFDFSALNYIGPDINQYAYMLEGVDEEWVYSGNRRFANYTGISPGSYIFRVKGSNNDGYWNEKGASVRLTIKPPPWKTWWAYTFYGIALGALLLALRLYDLKRQRLKQALELEQVEADKLKELDSMKSRFFANISHEFRTPLTLILGPLEKLLTKTDDKDCVKDLNMMQRNARRLQRLINQLLNLSKLEAGEMKLIAGERNIVSLVRGYVHSFESLAKQKNIKLKFASDDERTMIYIDSDKIEKVLYNLLSNALKFTPDGGEISVSVLTHPVKPFYKEGREEGINIIIADTGPGIPPDKVKRVFERFYQANNAYSGDQEGTGIGLALTQELVKLHHGDIVVESQEGKGTTFIITLPKGYEHLKPEEIIQQVKTEALDDEVIPDLPLEETFVRKDAREDIDIEQAADDKPILLLVEDNDDLRSYVRSCLDDDYTVHEAVDGELGLKAAIDKIPDLIISDVMMPEMDGYQLCRALKSDERTSHIPVILLTAKASKEDKIEGLEIGADDFLTKPFDPAELQVRIKNLIEQRQALRQKYLKELNLYPQPQPEDTISMDKKFLQKAYELVEQHLDDADYSVEQFMDEIAMSKVQLYRKLKGLLNLSAVEFIRSIRLSHAARMIREKADNIAQIAYAVGFNNPSYFAECFKKQFGQSPSEYGKGEDSK